MTREPRPSTAPKPVFPPSELCGRGTPEAADTEKAPEAACVLGGVEGGQGGLPGGDDIQAEHKEESSRTRRAREHAQLLCGGPPEKEDTSSALEEGKDGLAVGVGGERVQGYAEPPKDCYGSRLVSRGNH